jgi:hypothetical protein
MPHELHGRGFGTHSLWVIAQPGAERLCQRDKGDIRLGRYSDRPPLHQLNWSCVGQWSGCVCITGVVGGGHWLMRY